MAKKGKGMMEPRNIEASTPTKLGETEMYHEGAKYYGEGYGKPQNMPEEVRMSQYPRPHRSLDNEAYPDTVGEIDDDQMYNDKQVESRRSRSMY